MSNEMAMQMGMEDEVELIPATVSEPIIPSISRDEALHGGDPEESQLETTPATPPLPTRRSPLTTFKAAIAAAVGRHETKIIARDMFGREQVKTLHSQDVTELENKAFAELQLSETKDKWNIKDENITRWQKFDKGVERFFDRMWRGTATENLHRVKEYKHGIKLSATAGIEGAVSAEFNAEVDRLARKRIDEERQSWWQKTLGKGKDLFQETFALERDLHKYKVEATAKLRADFENNPLDTTNPLYHLVNRDIAAREEVARRLSDTPLEILQESNQKNTKVESIKLEGPAGKKVETFLKEQIFGKVIDDALSRSVDRTQPFHVSDKLRVNLDKTLNDYFFSDDFQEWRKTLTPEQQAAFENSFTYASTILTQAEDTLIPAVLDNVDHYRSADRLNFDIELALGTTQYSANTEAKLENWGARKERASMNQEIWGHMRRQVKSQTESTYQFRADAVNQGLRRERILGAVDSIVRNEMVAAATGVLVGKSVVTGLRAGLSWVPFIGGVVAGGASATKEWGRLNRMRAQYGFEEAVGLSHPQSENAKRSEQMRKVDYHRIELGRRVQQLSDMTEKLNTGSYTDADLLQTLGYLADSRARVKLSDHYGINLLTASKDTPEGRAIYQREIRLHDLARATTTTKLKEIIGSNGALGQSLGEKIGLLPGIVHQTDEILAILSQNLEVNLQYGTQIPTELQVALGSLTVSEAESIEARDQAFNKLRWTSSTVRGVTTGVIAGLAATGLGHFFGSHSETLASTHNVVDLKTVDHTLPTHVDNLGGIGHITNPLTDESVTMHAHLPAGTHLVVDPIRVGGPDDMETAYNLVGANNEVLVRGMHFSSDGHLQLTHEVRDALAHNHIEYEATPLSPITWETASETSTTTEIDPSQWTHSLTYEHMGGAPDTFFNNNVNQILQNHPEYAGVDNSTFINGLRYTLRGMENHIYHNNNVHINQIEGFPRDVHFRDSVWGKEFVIAPQADNAEITNLPDFIATAEGNERVIKLIHESIQQYNATQTFTDDVHRIAYEMSYGASDELKHIPDADEIKILVEYLGANSTPSHDQLAEHATNTIIPHDAWFTATERVTTPVEISIPDTYTMSSVEWYNALIPTGFARPLESHIVLNKRSNLNRNAYYYGYPGAESLGVSNSEYASRKSPRLVEKTNAVLNQKDELDWYLNQLTKEDVDTLNSLEQQETSIIDGDTRAIVCIPIYKEQGNIENTLEQYRKQVDENGSPITSKIRVVLYNNYVGSVPPDETLRVVNEYRNQHPELKITVLDHGYASKQTMGRIRRDLTNYAISQISKSNTQNDIVLVSNDGDVAEIDNKYIYSGIKTLESPSIDAVGGKLDFPLETYKQIPTLFAEQRAWQILDSIIKHKMNSGVPELTGANSIYKASVLAAIGGYNPKSNLGEDLEIGWMIKAARNWNPSSVQFINQLKLVTNPRRAVIEWIKGKGVTDRYASFSNNEEVYENKWSDLIANEGIAYDKNQLEVSLNKIRSELYSWVKNSNPELFDNYFKRMTDMLGIKFDIINNKIVITDDKKLIDGLKQYVDSKLLPA